VTACGLGLGRPLLRCSLGGTVFYICPRKPFQGLTFSQPTRSNHSARAEATLLCGGLAAHTAWIAVAGPLYWRLGHWGLGLAFWLNVAYLLIGLLPIQFRLGSALIESDARRILRVLRGRGAGQTPAVRFGIYRQCTEHLEGIRDALGSYAYRTELALLELDCGQLEAAAALLTDPAPPADCPPYLCGRFQLACHVLAAERGDTQAAELRMAAAQQAFALDAGALLTVELMRLESLLTNWRRGRGSAAAVREVRERADRLLVEENTPAWATHTCQWLTIRARVHQDAFAEAREALVAPGDAPEWMSPWLEGMAHQATGRAAQALDCHLRAIELLAPRLVGLDGPRRAGYLSSHEGLDQRVREGATALGDPEKLRLVEALLDPAETAPERIESHYGVLAGYFLASGVVIELVALWAFTWAPLPLLRTMITIGATCCLTGYVSALAALFTPDRKRIALSCLLLGLPAILLSLLLIGRLRLLLHPS